MHFTEQIKVSLVIALKSLTLSGQDGGIVGGGMRFSFRLGPLVDQVDDDELGVRVLLLGDDDLGGLILHLQDGPAAGVGVLLLGDGVRGFLGLADDLESACNLRGRFSSFPAIVVD